MSTSKARLTIYLFPPSVRQLDNLREQLRITLPIEARGFVSRSTAVDAAIRVALADLQARGVESDVFKDVVALFVVNEAQL